jgi:hypothetical protein
MTDDFLSIRADRGGGREQSENYGHKEREACSCSRLRDGSRYPLRHHRYLCHLHHYHWAGVSPVHIASVFADTDCCSLVQEPRIPL